MSDLGKLMAEWSAQQPSVSGLVLIGSRVRFERSPVDSADEHSDWDFHVITSNPALFGNSAWVSELDGVRALAYAVRPAVIGGVPKVNAVFSCGEADLVVIPEQALAGLEAKVAEGAHLSEGPVRKGMQDIAEVIRPGWRFLKGRERWGRLYEKAVAEVSDPHLSDDAVRQLGEAFVCDYVWTLRKIARGEFHAAQRVLHRELGEVNYQLLHELRFRRGERTFTKARRIEQIINREELDWVTISPSLDRQSLEVAIERAAATCRKLMKDLLGGTWRWPL